METEKEYIYALLGRNISYSFSRTYFAEKFRRSGLKDHIYVNFDLSEISQLPAFLEKYKGKLKGFNVTIPYKQNIFNFLDEVNSDAREIGAVNVVKVLKSGGLKGFNTDSYGFENSIKPLLRPFHKKALILGAGGASKAISFVLNKLGIEYLFVSRSLDPKPGYIAYKDLSAEIINNYKVIINATPVGTYPDIEKAPDIPYELLTSNHLLYDLIYNPPMTSFLNQGRSRGAAVKNGLEMLELQAEKSWEIWNS